jgi:hypothetical protein
LLKNAKQGEKEEESAVNERMRRVRTYQGFLFSLEILQLLPTSFGSVSSKS